MSQSYYPKTRAKKFEDTHKRSTFYVHHEILSELNRQAGREKGEKTRIVNEALHQYLYGENVDNQEQQKIENIKKAKGRLEKAIDEMKNEWEYLNDRIRELDQH